MTELSVVIPAYNEESRLGASLETIVDFIGSRGIDAEVLAVDDGSTDGTAALISSFGPPVRLVQLGRNRGKGAAVRAGVLASTGEQVLLSDADLSTPIEDLDRLTPFLSEHSIVFGSRATLETQIEERQPWYRQQMGRTFNRILHVLGVRGVRDTQCGFKLLPGELGRELFAQCEVERFAFDVELLLRARRAGVEVHEVGVRWTHVEASRVHPVIDSARMLWDVLRLRLRGV